PHRRLVGRRLAGRQHLIEQRLRVPQAAFRLACDERQRVVGEADAFAAGDLLQLLEQLAEPDAPEIVALAAGEYGGQDLVRVGGGEDELHVRRRLLERLQEGVEGVLREHVHFVDDVDLEAAPDRLVRDRLHEVPHLVDLGVRGAVDLEHVEGTSLADLAAVRALVAGLLADPALAVERLREETRRRRLAHPPRPGEEEGVGDAARRDGGLERARHVLLADDLLEPLRSEPAREHLVSHAGGPPRGVRRWRLGHPAAQRDGRYRCFLPDLTGFATLSCAGPNHHRPAPRGGAATVAGPPMGRKAIAGGKRKSQTGGADRRRRYYSFSATRPRCWRATRPTLARRHRSRFRESCGCSIARRGA